MRKFFADKKIGKSDEKKQQEAVIASTNQEQLRKESLIQEQQNIQKDVDDLLQYKISLAQDIVSYENKLAKSKELFQEKANEINKIVKEIEALMHDKEELEQSIESLHTVYASLISTHNTKSIELGEKIAKEQETLASIREEQLFILKTGRDEVDAIEKKKISLELAIKKLEDTANKQQQKIEILGGEIVKQNGELDGIKQMVISERELLGEHIKQTEEAAKTLSSYVKEVEAKREELELVKTSVKQQEDRIVSLLAREKRVNELIPEIKKLYKDAGVEINIA